MRHLGRVRVGDRVGDLHGQIDRPARIERTPRDDAIERIAGHELARQKRPAVVVARLIQQGDIGMGQRHSRLRVGQQRVALGRIALDAVGRDLDGDGAAEAGVARAKDLAETALADTLEDLVVRDAVQTGKIIR